MYVNLNVNILKSRHSYVEPAALGQDVKKPNSEKLDIGDIAIKTQVLVVSATLQPTLTNPCSTVALSIPQDHLHKEEKVQNPYSKKAHRSKKAAIMYQQSILHKNSLNHCTTMDQNLTSTDVDVNVIAGTVVKNNHAGIQPGISSSLKVDIPANIPDEMECEIPSNLKNKVIERVNIKEQKESLSKLNSMAKAVSKCDNLCPKVNSKSFRCARISTQFLDTKCDIADAKLIIEKCFTDSIDQHNDNSVKLKSEQNIPENATRSLGSSCESKKQNNDILPYSESRNIEKDLKYFTKDANNVGKKFIERSKAHHKAKFKHIAAKKVASKAQELCKGIDKVQKEVSIKNGDKEGNKQNFPELTSIYSNRVQDGMQGKCIPNTRQTRARKAIDYKRLSNEGVSCSSNNAKSPDVVHSQSKLSNKSRLRGRKNIVRKRTIKNSSNSETPLTTLDKNIPRYTKKEQRYIRALEGSISPPKDSELLGNYAGLYVMSVCYFIYIYI